MPVCTEHHAGARRQTLRVRVSSAGHCAISAVFTTTPACCRQKPGLFLQYCSAFGRLGLRCTIEPLRRTSPPGPFLCACRGGAACSASWLTSTISTHVRVRTLAGAHSGCSLALSIARSRGRCPCLGFVFGALLYHAIIPPCWIVHNLPQSRNVRLGCRRTRDCPCRALRQKLRRAGCTESTSHQTKNIPSSRSP